MTNRHWPTDGPYSEHQRARHYEEMDRAPRPHPLTKDAYYSQKLRKAIEQSISSVAGDIDACPWCGAPASQFSGRYNAQHNVIAIYCNVCGKNFAEFDYEITREVI